jgi:hypothetical protein
MPPGGTTTLSIETERDCPARYANTHGYPALFYHVVTVGIPGGGQIMINQAFDVLCGLYTGQFGVAQPPQPYTRSPVDGARASLELPSSVAAGTTLDYVVDLANPTGTEMVAARPHMVRRSCRSRLGGGAWTAAASSARCRQGVGSGKEPL